MEGKPSWKTLADPCQEKSDPSPNSTRSRCGFHIHKRRARQSALQRRYKDGEEWKHTRSFGRDDLLLVAKVARLAHSWIHAQQQAVAKSGNGPEPSP